MAKVVIAGRADCPYYARIELLADSLVKNLDDFKLHKIVKQPNEWEAWLQNECNTKGWSHKKSPIVWRELVDRGGKGMLIGGANEFQEYATRYYGIKSSFISDDMTKIASENKQTKVQIDEEVRQYKALSNPVNVCVAGAAGPSCYAMIHDLAKGDCLGAGTEIALRLFDSSDNLDVIEGVKMEAFDLACPLLRKISCTSSAKEAFSDCSTIVLLDEIEQAEEETKETFYKRNYALYTEYGKLINDVAKKDVKVIVAGKGPVNFNAYYLLQNAPSIPRQNVVAMSRLIENQAKALLAERLKVNSAGVVDAVVWGNANGERYVDVRRARVHGYDGAIWGPPSFSVSATEMVHDEKWLGSEFLETLAKRTETLTTSLSHKAAMSEGAAVASLIGHWWNGAPEGQIFSLGIWSEGDYDVPQGEMVYSLPVTFSNGSWSVVKDIEITDEIKEKLEACVKDLVSEKEIIFPPPKPPTPELPPEPENNDKIFGEAAEQQQSEQQSSEQSGAESDNKEGEQTAAVEQSADNLDAEQTSELDLKPISEEQEPE